MAEGYGAFADFYDRLTENISYPDRAAYYDRICQKHGGKRGLLLDLACGTGQLSVLWQDMGYEVIGVDASPEMLAKAVQRKGDRDILFLCQSMEELDLYGTVSAVFCAQDSLNHLTEPDALQRALTRAALFLEPGGLFLFDVNTLYKHKEVLGNKTFVYDCDDLYCVWQNELLPDGLVQIDLDLFSRGEDGLYLRQEESFCERAYPDAVWREMLRKAGCTVEAVYHADTETPPRPDSERVLYAAKRK